VLYTHATRRLRSKLPIAVKKYKEEVWKRLQAHNITNRSNNIATEAKLKHKTKNSTKNSTTLPTQYNKQCSKPN
jgi:hypothetical protein